MNGRMPPQLVAAVPGPMARAWVDILARHECPAVTARRARRAATLGTADDDPIVFDEAVGANIRDVDGNVFVDLTSGFGVALVGHRHPAVVDAAVRQIQRLPHAMGDAFPDRTRIALLERLAQLAPPGLDVALLGLSGSDAVDAALRTAWLATGRLGVLAFDGGYHGLALGVAGLQSHAPRLTSPFAPLLHPAVRRLPYGCPTEDIVRALAQGAPHRDGQTVPIGLVIAEPVLGRGGVRPPPDGWWTGLAAAARAAGALLAADEIMTGLGRCGTRWASGGACDLLLTGKALAGGFPLSACLGSADLMNAWGPSAGEALLTQTFLGHPVGCAAALAVLDLVDGGLPDQARTLGSDLRSKLQARGLTVRGTGLLLAVHVDGDPLACCRALLSRGFLALPAGPDAVGLMPPATLDPSQVSAVVDAFAALA